MKKFHDISDLKFEDDFLVIMIDGQSKRFQLEDFKQFYIPAWKRMPVWFVSAAIALLSLKPLECYFG